MFRENQGHLQRPLFSDLSNLSEKARARLETSWAAVFRREFFDRLDEKPFAVLFSDEPSRPNTSVNVLLGLESLKSGFDWSDGEMLDAFLFNLQVRYAVGYENVGEGGFDLRTVYNFRRRLCDHMRQTGENLIERAFEQITDEQIEAFQLKTGRLRMDSTQIASNIRRMGRVQLLVEVLQRVHRILNEADRARYGEAFAPYLKGSSGQYVYHLKGDETGPHLQRIGELMHRLVVELASSYHPHETYQVLHRVFHEQFMVDEELPQPRSDDEAGSDPSGELPADETTTDALGDEAGTYPSGDPPVDETTTDASGDEPSVPTTESMVERVPSEKGLVDEMAASPVQARRGQDISPASLQSPDDPEATYRKKGQQGYQGYVTNLTETCDADNPFQLIVKVQTEPNLTDDTTLLEAALPELKSRTGVHTLYNDAGFCGPSVDQMLRELGIKQVPTALRGRAPDPNRTTLADLDIQMDVNGQPLKLVCPHGYAATVVPGRKPGRHIANWDNEACPECRFSKRHVGRKRSPTTSLLFSQTDVDRALRRKHMRGCHQGKKNLRAAVEATIGALKRPFNNDKAPVRGMIRMAQMMIGPAAMINIRRIRRYNLATCRANRPEQADISRTEREEEGAGLPAPSLLCMICTHLQEWLLLKKSDRAMLVYGF